MSVIKTDLHPKVKRAEGIIARGNNMREGVLSDKDKSTAKRQQLCRKKQRRYSQVEPFFIETLSLSNLFHVASPRTNFVNEMRDCYRIINQHPDCKRHEYLPHTPDSNESKIPAKKPVDPLFSKVSENVV
jgi:hypothetical protein